ncbi:hypothetical protein [Phascolarctobacterium succinatutens]|uniref:hypothetical protein n=1 Tax=Phascolarctobacterium succinatutens TaxID=626940 RepID=UPI0026EB22AF|nr:hypothetical protein [Phascolarctobacterium succinatutens]
MMTKNEIFLTIAAALAFAGGFALRGVLHTCPVADTKVVTQVEYRDKVKTEIAYVPKETVIYKSIDGSTKSEPEKTDVEVKLNKPVLNVKVNDKDFSVTKAENERYLFDKNKLTLTQTSSTDLNIKIPVVDKTRRWGIGAGVSKDGAVGVISFPMKGSVGGWVSGRADNVMGGVMVRF